MSPQVLLSEDRIVSQDMVCPRFMLCMYLSQNLIDKSEFCEKREEALKCNVAYMPVWGELKNSAAFPPDTESMAIKHT